MAPLLPSNTARFRIFYTQLSHQHSFQMRSEQSPSAIGTLVDAFLTELTGSVASLSIDTVTWAPEGSDIFNPVTTGIESNTYGISGHPASDVATFWGWVGRTAGARRVRIYVFGVGGMGADYRYSASESAALDAARDVLADAGSDLMAIDGLTPVWKNYTNAGVNARWQKTLRP
jgi:hypothetical protein